MELVARKQPMEESLTNIPALEMMLIMKLMLALELIPAKILKLALVLDMDQIY